MNVAVERLPGHDVHRDQDYVYESAAASSVPLRLDRAHNVLQ